MFRATLILHNDTGSGPRGAPGWNLEKNFDLAVCPRKGEILEGIEINKQLVVSEIFHNLRSGNVTIIVAWSSNHDGSLIDFFDDEILNELKKTDPTWMKILCV